MADNPGAISGSPLIIPRAEHPISRSLISDAALKVLYRLRDAGYASFLVGGCVRDLMLGREPKDFDVVTDAKPEEIRQVFRNARLIGRRFRLAHVHFGQEIIEVATFRASPVQAGSDDEPEETARLIEDNVFGTQEEDAVRRDFTVNALYYDIRDFSVRDYIGGVQDLRAGILKTIGDPERRFREDPVRMLRAVRFAAKLGLRIDPAAETTLRALGHQLADVSSARLFEEVLKLFHGGHAHATFDLLRHYDLFRYLFPQTDRSLASEERHFPHVMVPKALENTDQRIAEDKPVNPAFLFAVLLWEPVRVETARHLAQGIHPVEAMTRAADDVIAAQLRQTAIPRRFSTPMREIWALQSKFERRHGRQAFRLFENKRFRAAYDFMLLRAETGEIAHEIGEWWTVFQTLDEAGRERMVRELAPDTAAAAPAKRRRRRRRGGGRGPTTPAVG